MSAAQRTRKSCRLDPHPSSTLLSTLDTTWEQLSEAVDEVKGHLEMAMDFHNLSEEVLVDTDTVIIVQTVVVLLGPGELPLCVLISCARTSPPPPPHTHTHTQALSSYLEWNRPIHQLPKTPQLIEDKIKDMTHNKDRLVANMKRAIG